MDTRTQLGKTTAGHARRAEGWRVRWKRNGAGRVAPKRGTGYFLLQPLLPLIQATLVRGALVLDTPARPVLSLACWFLLTRFSWPLLFVPRLPAVRYLRQGFPNSLDVGITPGTNATSPDDFNRRCRDLPGCHISMETHHTKAELLSSFTCRVAPHSVSIDNR